MYYALTYPTEQPGEQAINYFFGPVDAWDFWIALMEITDRYPFLRLSDIWFGEVGT